MSGTHKFTSSIWIQSGSNPATFQSGITVNDSVNVSGNITANKFIGDGSGITGIGTSVFFAGSGSGISASLPSSVDHVTELNAELANASPGYFKIETTSSVGFNPNHFVFIKLTNKFETLQAGSQAYYTGSDRVVGGDGSGLVPFDNDLAPGVHRYIVYATDTGSAGETHAVYTSAFIKGYVNVPPVIVAPEQSNGVVQIPHDQNTLNHILRFTGSNEPNEAAGDFIRIFSASRQTVNPIAINVDSASYTFTMKHHQSNIADSDNLIATGSIDPSNKYDELPGAGPGASALPNSVLVFTASITQYNTTDGYTNHSDTVQPYEERFTMTMFDNWYVDYSSSLEYSMSIVPPATASIRNMRARIESGSFTGIVTDTFTTPILYDDIITRDNVDGLHDRYTSSIVRVSVMADITEPNGYTAEGTHFTDVRIWSDDNNSPIYQTTFRFSGSQATASHYGTSITSFPYTTQSLGFAPFEYEAGTSTLKGHTTDSTSWLRHGDHDHISGADLAGESTLTVTSVPNIEISNVRVEVESGSFLTHEGAFERTASVLYGYTSSLKVSETSSLEGYEKSSEYISESVVRLRLLATVTEPFGPHHTKMISTLKTDGGSYSHTHEFKFHTGSLDTASSAIAYDSANRLVGNYTSSWVNFNLLPAQYTFSASFDSATTTGRTITPGIYAEISVSNTPSAEITNIVYETETSGYSEIGSTTAMRTVLYGTPRHTLVNSSSFEGHDHAVTYASHSVSRFRIAATITEPFGPHHTASMFEKVWSNSNDNESFNSIIHFSTGSIDTASSAIGYNSSNQLVSHYTSSWVGQQLSSSNNSSKTWTYTSGSILHTPHDLSGFITSSGESTQLVINDTAQIQLSNRIHEFEEYGHSASSAADTGVINTTRTVLYGSNRMTLADSSSLEGHLNKAAYTSQSVSRLRMRVRIAEPVGPAIGSVQFRNLCFGYMDRITAHTGSSDFESITHTYDSQKRLVAHYTQSWTGEVIANAPLSRTVSTADSFTTSSFSSSLGDGGENGIDKGTPTNASITTYDTVPTQITNIRYQAETFGYSNEPSTDTTRKVLYGVDHKTIDDTGSLYWKNHDSASLYASQSVTRFRVLATITEPIGPLHTASRFEKVWTADNKSTMTDVIHFSTASGDITASSVIGYDSSNRYVGHYTSSWIGVELASNNFTIGEQWKYTSGSILHEPTNENKFTTASGESTTLTVFDTEPTVFSNFKTETETYGYSGIPIQDSIRTVLYGNTTTDIDSSSYDSHVNSGSYASQSVSRFRLIGTITEPVGPLQHTASIIEKTFNNDNSKTETIIFGTGSSDLIESRSFFTEVGEFVTEYTSSWIGKALAPDTWSISTGSVKHDPPGENSANSSSFQSTIITVSNTNPTEISNIVYETETFGYSGISATSGTRKVLYGVPHHTLEDSSSFETHDSASLYASQSITRFRVLATITEPIGPLHTASKFEQVWSSPEQSDLTNVIHFQTASSDLLTQSLYYDSNKLVVNYTSSWVGKELASDTITGEEWTYTSGSILHTPESENLFTTASGESSTIIVFDTEKVKIEDIFWETETFGYSNTETSDVGRTVLYGNTTTDINSSSYENHVNSGSYASQSVSRIRFRAQVTDPIGPAVNQLRVTSNWDMASATFIVDTGSIAGGGEISYGYQDNKLVAYYTSSWIGREFDTNAGSQKTHSLTGHFTELATGENDLTQTDEDGTMTVYDTPATEISNIVYETETFGYSNEGTVTGTRKVLYGTPHHTLEDSSSFKNHDSASLYASQSITRFRVLTTITEPVGPLHTASMFEQVWSSPLQVPLANTLHFSTASGDITASSTIGYNLSNQLVAHYTSSWIGQQLSSSNFSTGEEWKYTSGSILHEPDNENKFTTASGESSIITVYDTQPTVFSNFKTETETFGYSGIPSQNAIRTVLYGDANVTNEDSSSFTDHINADIYASQSISQFRILATITEPVGPLQHTASYIEKIFAYNNSIKSDKTETLIFSTESIGFESSRSYWTPVGEFITEYTSSYVGEGLDVTTGVLAERNWTISTGSVIHAPYGENSADSSSFTATFVKVLNTDNTIIDNIVYETETYGHSEIGSTDAMRTVLYGVPHHTLEDSSSFDGHESASLYTSHSVTRFRIKAQITEPIGPLHTASRFDKVWTNDSGDGETFNSTLHFQTASSDLLTQSLYYNSANKLVVNYTSSWIGRQLSSSDDASKTWTYTSGSILHEPAGENSFTTASGDSTTLLINDTLSTEISNIVYETETFGYSGIGSTGSMRTALYGTPHHTLEDSSSFENHDSASLYASHSVSQFRVRAKITEPVGPLHTASMFEKVWTDGNGDESFNSIMHFNTASTNIISKSYSDVAGRFVVEYTSSWIGRQLSSSDDASKTWTYTSGSILHEPAGENSFTTASGDSTQLIVNDTEKVKIEDIFWETETFGYSGIETDNTIRTVLYGNTTTDTTSGSYENHVNSGSYASQSVSRIRFRARVTDPIGPAVNKMLATFNYGSTATFNIDTGSIEDGGEISYGYQDNKLVAYYTSSWIGRTFTAAEGSNTEHYLIGSFTELTAGENGLIESDDMDGTITVYDTPSTEITDIVYETETYGYSNTGSLNTIRRVLYGDKQVTNPDTSSLSWKTHDSASLYASHSVTRFRIRARITEPVGPLHTASMFEKVWTAPNRDTLLDVIHFSTSSGDVTSSATITYDSSNRFVGHYTSSWIGRGLSSSVYENNELISGEEWKYTSGSILHEPVNENSFTTASGDSTTLTIYDTQPTQFNNILLETETFGYSGISTTSTIRKVLYGVPHYTLKDSSSFENHDSASLYASQSITRFRISAEVIEPIGPHHTGSIMQQQFTSNIDASEAEVQLDNIPAIAVIESTTGTYPDDAFGTGAGYNAAANEILKITFNDPQLVTRIFIDSNPDDDAVIWASPDAGTTWIEQDNILTGHTPEQFYRYFEIRFGNTQNMNVYRIQVYISNFTEPIIYNNTTFKLNDGNTELDSSESFYDVQSRKVSRYTSSYFGVQLSSSNNSAGDEWTYNISQVIHNPIDSSKIILDEDPTSTTIRVYDTNAPKYDNFKTETETFGYSDDITQNTMRTVLYGDNQITGINSSSYEGHVSASIYASHSVSRFRVIAKITEPVGPLQHTASRSDMEFNEVALKTETVIFSTGSVNLINKYWLPTGEYVTEYTSSWVSKSLESGDTSTTWTIQNAIAIHVPDGENETIDEATRTTVIVRNTEPTQINSIAYETETFGYSGVPTTNSIRKVLYGDMSVTNVNSSSFDNHVNSGSYASHSVSQFRVRAKITEPVGPLHTASRFDEVWTGGSETFNSTLHFNTASNNIISRSYSDTAGRFVVEYTSSWTGRSLSGSAAGTEWKYTSGSILHTPSGENAFTTASGDSTQLIVNDTIDTIISNVRIETETVGHSGEGIQNTTEANHSFISRSILYGETTSFADSSSFEGLDSIFAERSVTRFRILADITEPIGPHHTGSLFAYTKNSHVEYTQDTLTKVPYGSGNLIIFSTASTQTASSDIEYNASTYELEASYTSSWIGETLPPTRTVYDGYWDINIANAGIQHTPIDLSGRTTNVDNAKLYMVVSASKPLTVTNLRTEVEEYPYSSSIGAVSRTQEILYGYNRTLSASDADTIGDLWSGSAAIRLRTMATITEPIGYRHFKTQVTMSNANVGERGYEFHTASLETSSRSERVLNTLTGEYATSYTSSWHDGFTFEEGTEVFTPSSVTGSDTVGIYMDTNGIDVPSTATVIIDDTPSTQITNIRIEAETYSGSMIGTSSHTTTILHGNTETEIDKDINVGYPTETARQQLTSIRLLADIVEPFGPHHTASKFTVTGYADGVSHIVTLHTGSVDVATKSDQMYDNHGSSSIAYTSSFVPVQLSQGIFTTDVTAFEHMFEDRKATTELTHVDITVEGSPTASVYTSPNTGSVYWSSSIDIDKYVTYNIAVDIIVDIISGISASAPPATSESILTFPQHLNILYTEDVNGLSFDPVNTSTDGEETGSLTIANSSMDTYTKVEYFTVNVSGSDILPGSGSSGNSPLTFAVIPAKPQSMHDKYWGSKDVMENNIGIPGIDIPSVGINTKQLYTGTLSEGLESYGPSAAGTVVTNIVMAKDTETGPANYSMSFNPFDAINTGNYSATDRLFDFGDSGSLVVRINGLKVIDYSLQYNFDVSDKDVAQDISSNYLYNGTASFAAIDVNPHADKGRLIVTRVEPFNNVSQSIYNAGIYYPNGYQGWSARIELDSKLNDGYNKLEFSHSFDDGTSQNWRPFEWHYDDNVNLATTRPNATASYSMPGSEPTWSRSGVSFFKKAVDIDISIKDAFSNIAGQTYPNKAKTIMETSPGTSLLIAGDAIAIDHNLTTETGLHFGTVSNLIPGKDQSGSLNLTAKAIGVANSGIGETKTITIKQYNRDYVDEDTVSKDVAGTDINIGRFLNTDSIYGETPSTDAIESFFFENYRWSHTTMGDTVITSQLDPGGLGNTTYPETKANFAYWVSPANANFNSNQSILSLSELQLRWDGILMYPSEVYTTNNLPNSIDYSGAVGDRYFYRAFNIGSDEINAFAITIAYDSDNPVNREDIWAQEPIADTGTISAVDSRNIRIDIKFPGPITSAPVPVPLAPGTEWGSIGGGSTTSGGPKVEDWISTSTPVITSNGNSWTMQMTTGNWKTTFVGQTMLMRVRFKHGTTAKITSIVLAPL